MVGAETKAHLRLRGDRSPAGCGPILWRRRVDNRVATLNASCFLPHTFSVSASCQSIYVPRQSLTCTIPGLRRFFLFHCVKALGRDDRCPLSPGCRESVAFSGRCAGTSTLQPYSCCAPCTGRGSICSGRNPGASLVTIICNSVVLTIPADADRGARG